MKSLMPGIPDVVYPVRKAEPNTELRFSLRSLRNLEHRQAVIVGYCPEFVRRSTVLHLPRTQDRREGATRNVVLHIEAAVADDRVSDPFYLFNDDFYVMVPMENVPLYHRGPLSEVVTYYRSKHHTGAYYRSLLETMEALQQRGYSNPLAYNLHVPMLIHKEPMTMAIAIALSLKMPDIRTIYGAMLKKDGTFLSNDPKRRTGWKQPGWEQWPLLSSNDDLHHNGVLTHLQDRFPGTSRYELD